MTLIESLVFPVISRHLTLNRAYERNAEIQSALPGYRSRWSRSCSFNSFMGHAIHGCYMGCDRWQTVQLAFDLHGARNGVLLWKL